MSEHGCWRHPRARGAAGRCIGRTDLPLDRRKAKRLAHRIRAFARQHGLPRRVATSPLQRARDVGRWLQRWGFELQVDARLAEMDFGAWDGRRWAEIPFEQVSAWEADFLQRRPGGSGESLADLLARVQAWLADADAPRLLVTHGGWINAARHLQQAGGAPPVAARWPAPPPHGALQIIRRHGV